MKFLEIIFKQIITIYIGAVILFFIYKLTGNNKKFSEIINANHKESNYDRIQAFYIGIAVLIIIVLLLKKFIK